MCDELKGFSRSLAAVALLLVPASSLRAEGPTPDYSGAIARLEQAVREEMRAWGISGIALALVDDQRIVHAAGFGEAKRDSIFRCGSISKLFNATAVMQLVESGVLDLDAPLQRYGPNLLPVNPFTNPVPVTLRQLLCHRSGMIRESPVGGYFDDAQAGLARTVASVPRCVLVNPPNSKTRYSNVGPSIAGRVVELVSGRTFPEYQRQHVLGPLGMTGSTWLLKDVPRDRLAPSYMRVADGQRGFKHRHAPLFDLGTIPAGNLFTTAEDLARFVSMLAVQGRAGSSRILKAESLAAMFTPQLTTEAAGFGLGFMVGNFRNHKVISHNGAVYGCSSSLLFLPDAKIGVVVLGNEDVVNARIGRLANLALSLMLDAKLGEKPATTPEPISLPATALAPFAGDYESQSYWARLEVRDGQLKAEISGQPTNLRPVAAMRFLADSRIHDATPMAFERDASGRVSGFTLGPQNFTRVPPAVPEVPAEWRAYFGGYGPSFIPLVISARHGHLYAMTENTYDYRLTPVNRRVFAFPPGLYADEQLVFQIDAAGKPRSVDLANMLLPRR